MDFMPVIEKYLGEFEHKGGKDVKIKTCPYCGSDDYKFLINPKTGRWICNHRNRCGEQGGINKMKLKFGIKVNIKDAMESSDNDECLKFDAAKQEEFTFLKKECGDLILPFLFSKKRTAKFFPKKRNFRKNIKRK